MNSLHHNRPEKNQKGTKSYHLENTSDSPKSIGILNSKVIKGIVEED